MRFIRAEKAVYEAVLLRTFGGSSTCFSETLATLDDMENEDPAAAENSAMDMGLSETNSRTELVASLERMARFLEQHQRPELARHYACKVRILFFFTES